MTTLPVMGLYPRDYLADTTHLTRDQDGGYLLLIMAMWLRGGKLPDDDRQLAQITKCGDQNEWQNLRKILSPFFKISNGFWHQKRLSEEYKNAKKLHGLRSDGGSKGAAKRWELKTKPNNGSAIGSAIGSANRTANGKTMADLGPPLSPFPQTPLPLSSPPHPHAEIPTPQSPPSRRGGAGRRGRSDKSPREIQAQAFFEVAHELAAARNRNC